MFESQQPKREAQVCDRPCDKCHKPMIGIMRISYGKTRRVCYECGGKALNA